MPPCLCYDYIITHQEPQHTQVSVSYTSTLFKVSNVQSYILTQRACGTFHQYRQYYIQFENILNKLITHDLTGCSPN